jgi:prepilin-type N-terminal cleavage/methylation domain-containing protein
MRRSSQSSPSRGGFTLVELLVVITIIAIMFALISAAAVKIMGKGDEVKLRSEVSQLALAVQAFKQQFAVGYVPSEFVLPPGADPSGASQQYFKSVWPRLNQMVMQNDNTSHAYWGVPNGQAYVLHGDQALVFWIGGTRDAAGNCIGFSTDPTDPMKQTGSRISPFYQFATDRLKPFNGPNPEVAGLPARAVGFPSYVDVYGLMPYLYFSTNKADNNYVYMPSGFTPSVQFGPIPVPNLQPNPSNPTPYNQNWFAVSPYQRSSSQFANPSSFQIVSAGKDGIFGQGGLVWATPGGSATIQSSDDVANFHSTFLGVPAQ